MEYGKGTASSTLYIDISFGDMDSELENLFNEVDKNKYLQDKLDGETSKILEEYFDDLEYDVDEVYMDSGWSWLSDSYNGYDIISLEIYVTFEITCDIDVGPADPSVGIMSETIDDIYFKTMEIPMMKDELLAKFKTLPYIGKRVEKIICDDKFIIDEDDIDVDSLEWVKD